MTFARKRLLLTTAGVLLLSASVNAQGWGGGNWDGNGNGNGNGNGGGPGCWWSGDCDDGGDSDGNGSGSGSNFANLTPGTAEYDRTNKIITVHAVLACLVWVLFIPLGGILIRLGIKSPWIVRTHAFLQSISYLIYIIAAGLGIYLVQSLSYGGLWQDPHTKLGIAILVLAFFQPFLGLIHHMIYKRRVMAAKAGTAARKPGRTAPGYVHLWLGRILIVLGIINGGLGLRLAAQTPFATNTKAKSVAYGVGAGVMFLLYVVFVVLGERRRSREKREAENDMSRSIPLVTHDADGVVRSGPAPPSYHHPPSYEDSQESLRKEQETTTRYQ